MFIIFDGTALCFEVQVALSKSIIELAGEQASTSTDTLVFFFHNRYRRLSPKCARLLFYERILISLVLFYFISIFQTMVFTNTVFEDLLLFLFLKR